ncbi:MAG: hydrogenase [Deltaproteobacteria bacterium]|nr:hydrogenase [Deltaproteobacteria bacterium]
MHSNIELILIVVILTDILLLGISMLKNCINIVALQGIVLGLSTVIIQQHALTFRLALIAAASILLKGIVFPYLLKRAIKDSGIKRELEPVVGNIFSILTGIVLFVISLEIGNKLFFTKITLDALIVPTALFTMFTGLYLLIMRKKAITQVLGYLVLENGIYIFGVAAVSEIPVLIEMGLLLDVFVAVFVMGIAVYQINREFNHIDTDKLNILKG